VARTPPQTQLRKLTALSQIPKWTLGGHFTPKGRKVKNRRKGMERKGKGKKEKGGEKYPQNKFLTEA